ncbi:MAG: selenocysteine-specific translation elongation factor [Deltaproteobacteria bacterium]
MVIGTAGHVDHGKTALVRALTGIDTDRLAEEKRRGITIELGFAHLALPNGMVAGVVDVPGHERFVRAMIAGAGGIDVVVLVVAADEGVMPQTREHIDVCRLLGVRVGVVALTKSDLLPELGDEWQAMLRADLALAVAGSFLEGAPVLPVSARTGEGLPALTAALGVAALAAPERPVDGPAYLPIDRAFTLKGFGTVVTGTLLSGTLRSEESVELLPGGPSGLRIRAIQLHGKEAPLAEAGQRTALNLPGVEVERVSRGMVLSAEGRLLPSAMLDAELLQLETAPAALRSRRKLLCHLGAAAVPATVVLLGRDELRPGEKGFAQLRLARPAVALPGQRFVLRSGRGQTTAGGVVLAVSPRKRRPQRRDADLGLAILRDGDGAARVRWLLADAGSAGLTEAELARRTALSPKALEQALSVLGARGEALLFDKESRGFIAGEAFAALLERAQALVLEHHRRDQLAPGLPKEELRQRLAAGLDPKLFQRLLGALAEGGRALVVGDVVRSPERASSLRAEGGEGRERIRRELSAGALSPPTTTELARVTGLPLERLIGLLKQLCAEGVAVRVKDDLYFDAQAIGGLRERLVGHLRSKGEITTPEFKELTGATRKFMIPLGEFFDHEKLTLRLGDKRVLRGERA